MTWRYEQSTGRLYKGNELVETGYSGVLTNKNNPDRQQVKGMGPLPRGTYRIAGHSLSKGPATVILEQTSGDSFGRSLFRIHGERVGKPAGFASEGCIIMSPSTRWRVISEGGTLEVVR
ncbi:tlde1 domain-containing protein [Rahnella sp. AN3-3W3]|uniref:tlde1 domain-containing protein n=1 Tax=Rahnella sp. AN3-3W3 TaxID=1610578 RepID=UPI000DD3045B|nr:tlde1 domain-containing protein [Rahnella sp. AN3-3W3]